MLTLAYYAMTPTRRRRIYEGGRLCVIRQGCIIIIIIICSTCPKPLPRTTNNHEQKKSRCLHGNYNWYQRQQTQIREEDTPGGGQDGREDTWPYTVGCISLRHNFQSIAFIKSYTYCSPSHPPRHQHYSTRTRHVKGERDNAAEEESPLAYMLIIYLFKLLTQSAPSSIQRIDAPGERRRGRESLLNY